MSDIERARAFVAEAMVENGDPEFAKAVLAGGYDNGTSVKAVLKVMAHCRNPDGYVLVPTEPSEKMIRAWVQWGWAAFLSASPEVPDGRG